MKTEHLYHKDGGKVTAVHAIAHSTYKGIATWHFICDVEWQDGGHGRNHEVAPNSLCYDHDNEVAKNEGDSIFAKLNGYLSTAGKWHEQRRTRDGRMYSWTPKKKDGRVEI